MEIKDLLLKLLEKQDEMSVDISEIKQDQVRNSTILEEHQRRSLANEENIILLRAQVKPLEVRVAMENGIFKAIAGLAVVVGIITGIVETIKFFIK